MIDDNVLIKSAEAKQILGIHLNTLYRLAKDKKIPSVKIGSQFRFNKKEILKLMNDEEFSE